VPNLKEISGSEGLNRPGKIGPFLSASRPKADMVQHGRDVRFVPKADSCSAAKIPLFNHLVGTTNQRNRKTRSLE
jgi:hypothetical protein